MFEIGKILGLKVHAIKGNVLNTKRDKFIEPSIILFDDGKTMIELEEQDYHDFHDCSIAARYIRIRVDELFWKNINENYKDANSDI